MDLGDEEMKEVNGVLVQVFSVFQMFGFKSGDDIRLGSLIHLFELDGASPQVVDTAIWYMLEQEWIVPNTKPGIRPGGHTLTSEGVSVMGTFLEGT